MEKGKLIVARDNRPFRDVGSDRNYQPFKNSTRKSDKSFPDVPRADSCLLATLLFPLTVLIAIFRKARDGAG